MNGMKKYYIAMLVLAAVSLVAVIWHYSISKEAGNDQQKVEDILDLQGAVDSYVVDNNKAPANLAALSLSEGLKKRLSDYTYSEDGVEYTICATFKSDISLDDQYADSTGGSPYYHKSGKQCFTRELGLYDDSFFRDDPQSTEEFDTNYYYSQ